MNFYDYERAKINIGMALMGKGWELYDFKFGESDIMTDYFENDTWSGIATKNGYTLVVRNDFKSNYFNYPALPNYQINPKGSTWHIEKDGQIIAKGNGLNKLRSHCYKFWNEKDIENIKHYEEGGEASPLNEDLRQYYLRHYSDKYSTLEEFLNAPEGVEQKAAFIRHNEEHFKFLTDLESLISKFELIVGGETVVNKLQSQPQKIKILNWEILESIHTQTKEKIYIAKQKTTLNKDEYLKVLFQVKSLGGYYSKFVSGFVFKTNPEKELEQIEL